MNNAKEIIEKLIKYEKEKKETLDWPYHSLLENIIDDVIDDVIEMMEEVAE